jgi:hypothetical protein
MTVPYINQQAKKKKKSQNSFRKQRMFFFIQGLSVRHEKNVVGSI